MGIGAGGDDESNLIYPPKNLERRKPMMAKMADMIMSRCQYDLLLDLLIILSRMTSSVSGENFFGSTWIRGVRARPVLLFGFVVAT